MKLRLRLILLTSIVGSALFAASPVILPCPTPGAKYAARFSPNGRYIAVAGTAGMAFAPNTGEKIFAFGSSKRVCWSPDGTMLLVESGSGIIGYAADSGQQCFSLPGASKPAAAPNRAEFAAVVDGLVVRFTLTGKKLETLTKIPFADLQIVWAREKIFLAADGGLYELDPESGELSQLLQAEFLKRHIAAVAVSPDEKLFGLVYSGGQLAGGGADTLRLWSPEGAEQELGGGKNPVWCPDGQSLLFDSKGNIFRYTLGTGQIQKITDSSQYANNSPHLVSPDRCCFITTRRDSNQDGEINWMDEPEVGILMLKK